MCVVCAFSFTNVKNNHHGSIEYTNVHNGTHYTRDIPYSLRAYPSVISTHECTLRITNSNCSMSHDNTQNVNIALYSFKFTKYKRFTEHKYRCTKYTHNTKYI